MMKTAICILMAVAGLVALPASAQAQLGPYARDRITAPARVYNARVYNAAATTYGAWGGCAPVVVAPVIYPRPVAYPVYPAGRNVSVFVRAGGRGRCGGGTVVGFNAFGW